jgi:integrase
MGEFKVWRLAQIQKRKESRGGTGLVLDVAILHKVFAVALKAKMIPENPVDFEGKPGKDPTRGAQPFEAAQLEKMRKHADEDLLTFLLLRWTGLRGSDAVALRWSEVRFDTREIERVTQKRTKKVIVPIHSELLAVLRMEHERRDPDPDDHVLLNPETGNAMTRPRLYHRMRALGKRAGVSNAHPHRYRDSFAVDMLARDGVSLYDVAKLLGDTVETVEQHYAEFVKGLRERVRRLMERTDLGLAAFETTQERPDRAKKNRAKALTM